MCSNFVTDLTGSKVDCNCGEINVKIGSIVYSTEQGLGILAKSFYDEGVISDVLVIRHQTRPNHASQWYPDSDMINPDGKGGNFEAVKRFCKSVDRMLFFETPFYWKALDYCRSIGVKTYLMPMYECLPPKSRLPYQPDYFVCPSVLDLRYFPDENSIYIPVPVPDWVQFNQRYTATRFLHNAGNGGLKGRNGTRELVEAIPLIKSPIKLTLRAQKTSVLESLSSLPGMSDPRVTVELGTIPNSTLYSPDHDVFVFPEAFNGLSLPLQEARASGMLVMSTNRYPNCNWLPTGPLITPDGYTRDRVSGRCVEFDRAIVSPRAIAETIDDWYGRDIADYSSSGKHWAQLNSWGCLKPLYMEYLSK